MPSSTARREKLVGVRHLLLIGCLFAVSFLIFKPKQQALSIGGSNDTATDNIDNLDLAYIKARAARGNQTPEEVFLAARSLILDGQLEQARSLLGSIPDIQLNDAQRYALDLELEAVEFVASSEEEQAENAGLQLFNVLHLLLDRPELQAAETLKRAAILSQHLDRSDLTVALFQLLAAADSTETTRWYVECSNHFSGISEHNYAVQCLSEGLQTSDTKASIITLRVHLLRQRAMLGDELQVEDQIRHLLGERGLSVEQTEAIAKVLLEIGRPEVAYPFFAQLAEEDEPRRDEWLLNAAKWSEASGRPNEAVNFIERLVASGYTGNVLGGGTLDEKLDRLLMAAGRNDEVFQRLLVKIEKHPEDLDYLETGIQWARQLGRNEQAAIWNEQLLQQSPANTVAVNRQIEISIAAADLKAARKWTQRLVELQPEDLDTRKRLAQVTEWSGDPLAAQRQWQALSKTSADPAHLSEIVRLSEMNFEPAVTADTYRKLSRQKNLLPEQRKAMLKAYELDGRPKEGGAALEEIITQYGASGEVFQELGNLHYRHSDYESALAVWDRSAALYGPTSQATLNRVELNWRLNQPDTAAALVDQFNSQTFINEASEYQISLLSEISWRYRKTDLALVLKPVIDKHGEADWVSRENSRIVSNLAGEGEPTLAAAKAASYYQETGDSSLALKAMGLALKSENPGVAADLLARNEANRELRKLPHYWVAAASLHLREGDKQAARDAYQNALTLAPNDLGAISGWLWMLIGESDIDELLAALAKYESLAEKSIPLWGPYAVGYSQAGFANQSLKWFELLGDSIGTDYSMLLSFADALEFAGRAEHAWRVRQFTLRSLRPLLANAIGDEQEALLRQYAGLQQRYGSADANERWAHFLLSQADEISEKEEFWREDMAIAWLMSTQRHEHARMIMAGLHNQRSEDPLWQKLALAMGEQNLSAVKTIIDNSQGISPGNRILANTLLGNNNRAYRLTRKTLENSSTYADRVIAQNQYVYLRGVKPSYTAGQVQNTKTGKLASADKGIVLRHSFVNSEIGLEMDFKQKTLSSDFYNLADMEQRSDLALTLFLGDSRFGGSVTAGFLAADDVDRGYSSVRLHHSSAGGKRASFVEMGFNETATQSPELRIAGIQNRLTLGHESSLGAREYVRFQIDANDIKSRTREQRIARGLDARVELGIRDSMGSNTWSASLAAAHSRYDRASALPAELQALSPTSNIDSVMSQGSTAVYLGGSLSRGGVNADFPQTTSPRYYINGNLGHSWPDQKLGVQFEAGAGFRVLGGDELSFSMSHDALASQVGEGEANSNSIGINYRYHFRH